MFKSGSKNFGTSAGSETNLSWVEKRFSVNTSEIIIYKSKSAFIQGFIE